MVFSLKPSDIHQKNIALHPLHDQRNYLAFQTLLELVRTSIGPHGKLKIIQNVAGGHVSITSCSSRLFHLVSIKNIFLRFIAAGVNSHLSFYGNGGLCCCIFTLLLMKSALDQELHKSLSAKLNGHLGKMFTDLMESPDNSCIFNIDFNNVSQLQSIVHSIVSSKPGCFFSKENQVDITFLLLKAFINAIPNDNQQAVSPNVSFFTEEGLNPSESRLLDGILLQTPMMASEACVVRCVDAAKSGKQLKIALFLTSLAGDAQFPSSVSIESNLPIWKIVLSHLETIAEKMVSDDIDILLCQQVVHPTLKKKFNDNNVLVVDRLGVDNTRRLQLMTGAVSVSSLSEAFDIHYGFCTTFENLELGKKKFILLQNIAKPLWTVFLCNFNEETLIETKAVCIQAINTLYRLVKDPRVCCGGGCSEMYTSYLLKRMVITRLSELSEEFGCTSNQLFQALQSFISSLEDFVVSMHQGSKLSYATETVCGHLWELPNNILPSDLVTCKCGKYRSESISNHQWLWLHKGTLTSIKDVRVHKGTLTSLIEDMNVLNMSNACIPNELKIVDELCVKINAFKTSVQVSSSLLQLGLIITP